MMLRFVASRSLFWHVQQFGRVSLISNSHDQSCMSMHEALLDQAPWNNSEFRQ